jgi:hypothetical protein
MRCLPFDTGVGEPGLEDRLAAAARWFTAPRGGLPAAAVRRHGRTRVLADAGLVGVGTRSFLLDVGPPLDADQAAYVLGHLRDLLERLDGTLQGSDRRALARLTDPSDPADLGRRDDVLALGVQSIHVGTAPAPPGPRTCPTRPAQQRACTCRHPFQGGAMHPTTPGIGRNR